MRMVDIQRLKDEANHDPEFKLVARLLNARLRLRMGDDACIITIRDGVLIEVNDTPTFFHEWDIDVGGSLEGWQKLLQPVPPPLFQDLFPATIHGGFSMGGNLELLFSYYPAFRRLTDLLRRVALAPKALV